jgi:hypothetical protein
MIRIWSRAEAKLRLGSGHCQVRLCEAYQRQAVALLRSRGEGGGKLTRRRHVGPVRHGRRPRSSKDLS